jgi:hypothetical protein
VGSTPTRCSFVRDHKSCANGCGSRVERDSECSLTIRPGLEERNVNSGQRKARIPGSQLSTLSFPLQRTHDVAAACRPARAEVRVQLPLGAFSFAWHAGPADGCRPAMWESLEIRVPRAHESVGSNPTTLTGSGREPRVESQEPGNCGRALALRLLWLSALGSRLSAFIAVWPNGRAARC